MKKMKKALVLILILALTSTFFTACGGSSTLSVSVSNKLDYDVMELYISSANTDDWGTSALGGTVFADADNIQVSLEPTDSSSYNVMAVDTDGDYYYFYGLPLSNGASVELVSTDEWYEAVVTPKKGDPITIEGDFEFGDDDSAEDTVSAPTPDDPLDATVAVPGYESLSIPYPSTMKVAKTNADNRFIQFDAVNDDSNNGISFNLIQLQGSYDDRLSSSATAQSAMEEIVGKVIDQTLPGMLIKTLGTQFIDGGTYYEGISSLWMSGAVFEEAADTPVRGVLECRYYGHTGYIIAALTLADEGVIQNYFGIAGKIFDSISFGGGWTTPDASGNSGAWSDPEEEYNDYDPWSDPEEYYYDYDPWSDPEEDPSDYDGYEYNDWSDPAEDPSDYDGYDYDDWSDPGDYCDDGSYYYDDGEWYESNDYDF